MSILDKIQRIRNILEATDYAFTCVKSTNHKLFGGTFLNEKDTKQIILENKQLLNELWHLKDHVKQWLKIEKKPTDIVEKRINTLNSMKILGDLITDLKHGEHRIDRSGCNPKIGEVEAFLKVNTGEVTFERHPDNKISINASSANPVYFTVSILDDKNIKIGTAASIGEDVRNFWRDLLKELNFPFE